MDHRASKGESYIITIVKRKETPDDTTARASPCQIYSDTFPRFHVASRKPTRAIITVTRQFRAAGKTRVRGTRRVIHGDLYVAASRRRYTDSAL